METVAIGTPTTAKCPHLSTPTTYSVEQVDCGCPGARLTTVCECDLHDYCAPFARVEKLKTPDPAEFPPNTVRPFADAHRVTICRFCPDNPAGA